MFWGLRSAFVKRRKLPFHVMMGELAGVSGSWTKRYTPIRRKKPRAPSRRRSERQVNVCMRRETGHCARAAPSMPTVIMSAMINPRRFGSNHLVARVMHERKQNALPMPEMKWKKEAETRLKALAKPKMPMMQRTTEARITRRTDRRSRIIPAGMRKRTSAKRYDEVRVPQAAAFNLSSCITSDESTFIIWSWMSSKAKKKAAIRHAKNPICLVFVIGGPPRSRESRLFFQNRRGKWKCNFHYRRFVLWIH